VGLGERLSCKIMTAVLRDQVLTFLRPSPFSVQIFYLFQGIDAEYVSLENIIPDSESLDGVNDDETLGQIFYDNLTVALRDRIEQCGSRVPVVTGPFIHILF
jgi:aspartate kinase